jgi:hypothetical protein
MAALLLWGCDQSATSANSGGTNDETSTFYLQSGRVAARAAVTIFAAGRADSLPATKTYTDGNGHLDFPSVPKGYYSLVVRDTSGQAAFLDSIFSNGAGATVPSDTLRPTGSVTGRVKVQPQDDPRIAWVALLGAGIFVNVDDSGRFAIHGVPEGKYSLMARADQGQYTSTFAPAPVWRDSTTDLGTIQLVYTGLPVVTGISGTWDSLGGIIHLHWDTAGESRAFGYRIYKGSSNDPSFAPAVAFVSAGTDAWVDTVIPRSDSMSGETKYVHYQVTAVGQDGSESALWNFWSDTVRSPDLVAQLPATWTLVSSDLSCCDYGLAPRLDTLPGNLLMVGQASYGTTTLSIAPDGRSWNALRVEIDSTGWTNGGGLSRGVVYQDKFWWVRSMLSTRSFLPPGSYSPYRLADSLVVLSIDVAGHLDSTPIAASTDSTSHFDLIVDSAGLVLLEGMVRYNGATSMTFSQVVSRRLRTSIGTWQDGSWASWYPDLPTLVLPNWFSYSSSSRIVSPQGRTTIMQGYTTGAVVDQDVRMLEATSAGLYYTTTPSTPRWHRVQGTPGDLGTLTSFQGSIWVTQSDSLWKVSLP